MFDLTSQTDFKIKTKISGYPIFILFNNIYCYYTMNCTQGQGLAKSRSHAHV